MAEQRSPAPRLPLGCMALMLMGLVLVCGAAAMLLHSWLAPAPATAMVVQTQHALRAFETISAGDVILATPAGSAPEQALTDTAVAVGRMVVADSPAKTVLTEGNTVAAPNDWWLIAVPVTQTVASDPGTRMVLLGLEPGKTEAQVISTQALTLGRYANQLVIAVPPEEARRAAAYLAGDRRLFAWPAPAFGSP